MNWSETFDIFEHVNCYIVSVDIFEFKIREWKSGLVCIISDRRRWTCAASLGRIEDVCIAGSFRDKEDFDIYCQGL